VSGRKEEPENNETAERSRILDSILDMGHLCRRWVDLILQRFYCDARLQIADVLTALLFGLVGLMLLIVAVGLLDLLLYRWLSAALNSGNWALLLLALVHVVGGGFLLRYGIARLKGDVE
jgi:hypothetical protein